MDVGSEAMIDKYVEVLCTSDGGRRGAEAVVWGLVTGELPSSLLNRLERESGVSKSLISRGGKRASSLLTLRVRARTLRRMLNESQMLYVNP